MTSESDESIQIYNVKDGKHQKACLSKKYGVKLAKFSRTSACIVYASTKENGMVGEFNLGVVGADTLSQTLLGTFLLMTTHLLGTFRAMTRP
jgi:hypothetical protein